MHVCLHACMSRCSLAREMNTFLNHRDRVARSHSLAQSRSLSPSPPLSLSLGLPIFPTVFISMTIILDGLSQLTPRVGILLFVTNFAIHWLSMEHTDCSFPLPYNETPSQVKNQISPSVYVYHAGSWWSIVYGGHVPSGGT